MKLRNGLAAGILAALLSTGAVACNDDGALEDPLGDDPGLDEPADGDDPLLDS